MDLVDGLKAAKSKRAYFALVLKGSNDGALIVSKTKVPPAEIAAAKKESGGSAVLTGFCRYEDGIYVFETAKNAPATAAQAVRTIAKRDAKMPIQAEFRVSTDPELLAGEAGSSTAQPQATSTQPDGAAVTKRFHAMTPDIKAALGGPNDAQVKALFVATNQQLQSKDFAQASKLLDELAPLLKKPAAGDDPAKLEAAYQARVKALTDDLKKAIVSGAPAGNEAKVRFSESQTCSRKQDFAQAMALLDVVEEQIKLALGSSSGDAADSDEARWTARRQAVEKLFLAALQKQPANAGQLRAVLAFADGKAEANDFGKALQGLDSLEKLLGAAGVGVGGASGSPASQTTGPKGLVAKRKFLVDRWKRVQADVTALVNKLGKAITAEMPGEDGAAIAGRINDRLELFYEEFNDSVIDSINEGDANYAEPLKVVAEFKTKVQSDVLIQHLDANILAPGVQVGAVILAALDEAAGALRG